MSYLDSPRLHFAGTFQAAPSTVNNDPLHFDNTAFKPEYQQRGVGNRPDQLLGWWNPRGDATWRLIGCGVTAAVMDDGSPVPADDLVLGSRVADSDRAVAAKLVDLDPEQQLVSTIWGLEIRIATASGETLARGEFAPTAFTDIWDRAQGGGAGDIGAGAAYQSVLTELEWADAAGASPFLTVLRDASRHRRLSVKFNVDGYNMDFHSPHFTRGRIVGTIGVAGEHEPRHFVAGRQFLTSGPDAGFFGPVGKVNFCVASVDRRRGKVVIDLGNALPTTVPGGPMVDLGPLSLVCAGPADDGGNGPSTVVLGEMPPATYAAASWYESTAGVVELPADRALTRDELAAVGTAPLAILVPDHQGQPSLGIAESPGGLFVRADQFVHRLDPGQTADVRLHATRFGRPFPNARIVAFLDPSQLQVQVGSPLGQAPDVATPADALDFPARVVADERGTAHLEIQAGKPGNPRDFIDGQVYGVRALLEETIYSPSDPYPVNPWDFVSVLVWDAFEPDDPPTWHGSIEPILRQYANLYPVMDRILDLGDYDSVCEHRDLLLLAFGLHGDDPNSMPVSRDLSEGKRSAILRWLRETGSDDKPRLGTVPAVAPPSASGPPAGGAPATSEVSAGPPADQAGGPPAHRGGKAAAASQRLASRQRSPFGLPPAPSPPSPSSGVGPR